MTATQKRKTGLPPSPNTGTHRFARNRWETKFAILAIFVVAIVTTWQLTYDSTDFLPSPMETLAMANDLIREGETWESIIATVRRLVCGLLIGYIGGVALALIMRRASWINSGLQPFVYVALTMPSLSIALISLMVVGLAETGVYIAVAVIVFPFVVVSLSEGLSQQDKKLDQMVRVFNLNAFQRIRHQSLPEIAPYLFASFRNVHALAWKVVVIAELFTQENGVGVEYQNAYEFYELSRLIVWAIFFMVMVLLVEYVIVKPIEYSVFRWRSE